MLVVFISGQVTVQGWELHALRGATALLSRPGPEAPLVMYEEDRLLLRASNTTPNDIHVFLHQYGYDFCDRTNILVQCQKQGLIEDS